MRSRKEQLLASAWNRTTIPRSSRSRSNHYFVFVLVIAIAVFAIIIIVVGVVVVVHYATGKTTQQSEFSPHQ
jgi:hypothetical protein